MNLEKYFRKVYKYCTFRNTIISTYNCYAIFQKFENVYHEQLRASHVTQKAQFEYAWCLVRSKYSADIRKGILLLEDLYNNYDTEKRDCLYYLAIGNARIKVNMVIMSEYV